MMKEVLKCRHEASIGFYILLEALLILRQRQPILNEEAVPVIARAV